MLFKKTIINDDAITLKIKNLSWKIAYINNKKFLVLFLQIEMLFFSFIFILTRLKIIN